MRNWWWVLVISFHTLTFGMTVPVLAEKFKGQRKGHFGQWENWDNWELYNQGKFQLDEPNITSRI